MSASMINLHTNFERVYIINLLARGDRRAEMCAQLLRIGLSEQTDSIRFFEAARPDHAGEYPSVGARGCFLSHMGILQKARDDRLQSVLILEDDLNFVDNFLERYALIADEISDSPFGVFYGGGSFELDAFGNRQPGLIHIDPNSPVGLTHFIGFRGADCISAVVDYLQAMNSRKAGDINGGPMHVDGAYSWFRREHPQFHTTAAHPELGYQRASRTDIHQLRWFDTFVGFRSLASVVRRFRNG